MKILKPKCSNNTLITGVKAIEKCLYKEIYFDALKVEKAYYARALSKSQC